MAGRYTTLIIDSSAHTGVERLRRLRVLAGLRDRLAEDPRAVSFAAWLAEQPPEALARAAAGLAELGMPQLAERLRGLAFKPIKATPVEQLLGMDNATLKARVEVGQALRSASPELARRTRTLLEQHSDLRADAALPEVSSVPPGRRRWRVPAVVKGGLPGVIEASEQAAARLKFTRAEMRTRLEDRVRGEVGSALGFDWTEPFQCHQTSPMETDPEPPLGAVQGDVIVRPVAPPKAELVEGFRVLLGDESPLQPAVRDGQLVLVDRRAEPFAERLWAVGNAKRPKTRPERVGWRVWSALHLLHGVGLAAFLEAQGQVVRQTAQGFHLVGLDGAAQLLHRIAARLAPEGVAPEDVDWAARIADLSTLGTVRFGLFDLAMQHTLRAAESTLFDYLEANRWKADEAW